MQYAMIDTALGTMGLAWTETGVARLALPGDDRAARSKGRRRRRRMRHWRHASPYGAGERVEFDDVPLDLGRQPPFHQAVYDDIPAQVGETTTYGDIARRLAMWAVAAVGQALGRNPIPLIVPCRVLAADGRPAGSRRRAASAKM